MRVASLIALSTAAVGCGPSAEVDGGSDGGSSGDSEMAIEALRQRWPGGYAQTNPGGSLLEHMSLMEFDPDGRAYDYSLNCLGSRSMPPPYSWNVVSANAVEVYVTRESESEKPVGEVVFLVTVATETCGPHRLQLNPPTGVIVDLWPGRFCPENVVTGENYLKCDFVACNDVSQSCAEENSG